MPPTDEDSNFGMFRESLLDRLPGKAPDVRRIPGELGPDAGAAAYELELRADLRGKESLDSTCCSSASGRTATVRLCSPAIPHSRSASGWRWASPEPALRRGFHA